jgi:hypothetical protein
MSDEAYGDISRAVVIVGRRASKSIMAAVKAVCLAIFFDYRKYLSIGERVVIQIIAAEMSQLFDDPGRLHPGSATRCWRNQIKNRTPAGER